MELQAYVPPARGSVRRRERDLTDLAAAAHCAVPVTQADLRSGDVTVLGRVVLRYLEL